MSLVELIAQADERVLAASGLACLDRCLPLLGGDDEVLRPLWATFVEGAADGWSERLGQARDALGGPGPDEGTEDDAARLARGMLAAAPAVRSDGGVRAWADSCSVASLRIHQLLDPAEDASPVDSCRAGGTDGVSPLVAAELRRQVTVIELVGGHGPAGLLQALEVSAEGRRVLQAVVSRRARGRA
ncbi:hypothetical protein [Streptomyces tropicalis]|uniref:Uncharacterized protein n=1 Tax=Streptomyces tropicalis TaxID=3034234 RepID=A0ABT6A0V0_9ACTN|nr:hypothetical protein [Streptomyces tropicalis]MDF3298270.1 hypothetical protein [Streptomyces tropicalis]